eukprot:TRINITY_DN6559_c0_g1_i4.p1 TRINITY_DN6559_c0_g1~~TRINITY_DN6559_c0_g1_i4.p1  ORF type:complete len:1290 (+),score=106.44 TRINITY_DN6559_c0_g1_i4:334-3870(+)
MSEMSQFERCLARFILENDPKVSSMLVHEIVEVAKLSQPVECEISPPTNVSNDTFMSYMREVTFGSVFEFNEGLYSFDAVLGAIAEKVRCNAKTMRLWWARCDVSQCIMSKAWPSEVLPLTSTAPGRRDNLVRTRRLTSHSNPLFFSLPRRRHQRCMNILRHASPMEYVNPSDTEMDDKDFNLSLQVQPRHSLWRVRHGSTFYKFDFLFIVDCVILSTSLRSIATLTEASQQVLTSIFGAQKATGFIKYMSNIGWKWPKREIIRRGRIRLDIACMLFNRYKQRDMSNIESLTREIFIDASKAFGREVIAFVEFTIVFYFDDESPHIYMQRLPAASLRHMHTSAADKAAALVHAVWLMYGPSCESVLQWFESVRVMPTDLGTEHLLANSKSCIPSFLHVPPSLAVPEYLFPYVMKVGGFNHILDNIVQMVTHAHLSWIASFIGDLKRVLNVFCDPSYRDVLHDVLLARGFVDYARLYSRAHALQFNAIRWGTLVASCNSCLSFKHSAIEGWLHASFSLDATTFAVCDRVFKNPNDLFWRRCEFIIFVFGPVEQLRSWSRGVIDHPRLRLAGKPIRDMAGRLLRFAFDAVADCIACLRELARNVSDFIESSGFECIDEVHTYLSVVIAQMYLKFTYLDELPYILVRVRDSLDASNKAVQMYEHRIANGLAIDRLSQRFLDKSGPIRAFIDIRNSSGVVPHELTVLLRPYELGKLDESIIEGEHRSSNQEQQRAHGCKHAFGVATTRLPQNLEIVDLCRKSFPAMCLLKQCWYGWKVASADMRLPLPNGKKRFEMSVASKKSSFEDMCKRVYHINASYLGDLSCLNKLFSNRSRPIQIDDSDNMLIRYVGQRLTEGHVYSLPAAAIDNWSADVALTGGRGVLMGLEPPTLENLMVQAPISVWRAGLQRWRCSSQFDADGWFSYCVADEGDCFDSVPFESLPVLVKLEKLAELGWRDGRGEIPHSPRDGEKTLHLAAGFSKSSFYLDCLFQLEDLFAKGLKLLHVKQSVAYYRCVLTSKELSLVLPNLKAREYASLGSVASDSKPVALPDIDAEELVLMADETDVRILPIAPLTPRQPAEPFRISDAASRFEVDDDVVVEVEEARTERDEYVRLIEIASDPALPTTVRGHNILLDHCEKPTRGPKYVRKMCLLTARTSELFPKQECQSWFTEGCDCISCCLG